MQPVFYLVMLAKLTLLIHNCLQSSFYKKQVKHMYDFKVGRVFGYTVSFLSDRIRIVPGGAGSESTRELGYEYLDALWHYFKNADEAIAAGSVEPFDRSYFFTFDDKGTYPALNLRVRDGVEEIGEKHIDALRELFGLLDGEAASSVWTERLTEATRAMLAIDHSPGWVDAILSDEAQSELWMKRAEAVLNFADQQ